MLNWDISYDLAQEIIISNEKPEDTTKFIFSNKQSLDLLRSFISKVDIVRLHDFTEYDDKNLPRHSSNKITLEWVSY